MRPGKFCLWLQICFSIEGFADRRGGRQRGQGKKQEIFVCKSILSCKDKADLLPSLCLSKAVCPCAGEQGAALLLHRRWARSGCNQLFCQLQANWGLGETTPEFRAWQSCSEQHLITVILGNAGRRHRGQLCRTIQGRWGGSALHAALCSCPSSSSSSLLVPPSSWQLSVSGATHTNTAAMPPGTQSQQVLPTVPHVPILKMELPAPEEPLSGLAFPPRPAMSIWSGCASLILDTGK